MQLYLVVHSIDLAEDRDRFRNLINKLKLKQAESGIAKTFKQAIKIADKILSSNTKVDSKNDQNNSYFRYSDNDKKIEQILYKMRILLKKNNNL